jgi:hypothetical protein
MGWSYCENCGSIEDPRPQTRIVMKLELEGTIGADDDTSGKVPHKEEQKVVYVCSDCGVEVEFNDG